MRPAAASLLLAVVVLIGFCSVAHAPTPGEGEQAPPTDGQQAPPTDGQVAPPLDGQQTQPQQEAPESTSSVGDCEVCVYVLENKQQHQPYLCRGLKDPSYQKSCVEVLESLMWWITNEVYWNNYGCEKRDGTATEWVRPCPAHAICSWIENLTSRQPFCPPDDKYPKPQ